MTMNKITILLLMLVSIPTTAEASTVEAFNNASERNSSLLIKDEKYQEAITLLLPLSQSGDAESQTQLGSLYENGLGVPLDMTMAIRWYQTAAEQNYPRAQVNLGVLYQYGTGVNKDLSRAIYWFKKAVVQNDPRGEGKLGYLYIVGEGVEKNHQEGMWLLESSAAGGYAEAQFNLAMLLRRDDNKDADYMRSIALLQRSADQKHPPAMNVVALLHLTGELHQDLPLSYRLLHHAAALGFEPAQVNLSKLCHESPEVCKVPE